MRLAAALCLALLAVSGCSQVEDETRPVTSRDFPRPYRPVSAITSNAFSNEQSRDDRREAQTVMDLANIRPGMTVADIGAGEGYYTVRLAERVGGRGRVLAEDIDRDALARLGSRSKPNSSTMSRSSSAPRTIRACPRAASTAFSWSTCTTR